MVTRTSSPLLAPSAAPVASCGQPCVAWYSRFGSARTAAAAPPTTTPRDSSARPRPVTTSPTASDTSSIATSSLFQVLRPTTTPVHTHHRGCSRTTARSTSRLTRGHTTRSSEDVSRTWPNSRVTVLPATAVAASSWARRSPPTSRASSAATTTDAAAQAAAGRRTAHGWSTTPARVRARNGTSGGWSV